MSGRELKQCGQLFQLNILNDGFLINWSPLVTLRPKAPANCVANTICFLNLRDRQVSQQLSVTAETGEVLGMYTGDIIQILKEVVRDSINIRDQVYPINMFLNFFNRNLANNSITILNLIKDPIGHSVAIAKTHDSTLVIFDPQSQIYYYGEDNIGKFILEDKFVAFSVYYETNVLKRPFSSLQSILRRNKNEDGGSKKKYRREEQKYIYIYGGRKKRQKTKNKKQKTKNKKQKTKNKKQKTKNKKQKTVGISGRHVNSFLFVSR